MMPSHQTRDNEVELSLWEPSGVNRDAWPVTFGVPFPKGVLEDANQISIWDTDRALPVMDRVTARWEDGSISWLLLDFQVDLRGNEKKRLILKFGEGVQSAARPEAALSVREQDETIIVANGDMRIVFKRGGRMPFDDLLYKGRSILQHTPSFCTLTEKGRVFHAAGDSVRHVVEDQNDLRVVVRGDGKFTADGTSCLDLTTRVYLYAGKPFVKVFHTLTNLEGRDVYLDDLSVHFPLALKEGSEGYITGQGLDDSIHPAKNGEASLSVKTIPVPETKYDAEALRNHVHCKDRLPEIHGTMERRADDTCTIQSGDEEYAIAGASLLYPIVASALLCGGGAQVSLSCRNFYPQAPKRIAVDGDALKLSLYWNFEDTPLQFWRGTAKTHELFLTVSEGDALADREGVLNYKRMLMAVHEPVAPTYGESNWLQRTEVFGPLFPYKPDQYPWLEFIFRSIYERWSTNPAQSLRGSTMLNFGDYWNPSRGGQWQNNEMDFGMGMLLYMLRTGYPRPFGDVERSIHHMMDVDTHHEAKDPLWIGAQRYHQVRHGAFSPPLPCHQWLEGPLFFYLITGYERGKEIALRRAAHFCGSIEAGHHRIKQLERVQGWPLVALSTMNFYFPDERYVRCCNAVLDWLEQWIEEDGDMVYPAFGPLVEGEMGGSILGRGVIGQALTHYHRVTPGDAFGGDKRAWDLLLFAMNKAKETLFTPEGLSVKTSLLRRNYYAPGESDFILEAFGYLWEKTGDPEWMRLAIRNFKLALIHRNPVFGARMGVGGGAAEPYRHWPPFLYYADKSGLLEDIRIF